MLRTPILILLVLLVAIPGGAWSVWWALEGGEPLGTLDIGGWTTHPSAGTPSADPYSRAQTARTGDLSLGAAEGLPFVAIRDTAGAVLTRDCAYSVRGKVPPARLFTLYAADPALALLPGRGRLKPAVQSSGLIRDADGSIDLQLGGEPKPGNWLPLEGSGEMRLVLTLYDTPVAAQSGTAGITLPTIERTGCGR